MVEYLDANATTPVDPRVLDEMIEYTAVEYGNAGSRTHEFGARAKRRVNRAREQVATVVSADGSEVVFTSGATESNNLAILGLAEYGRRNGKRHIVSTAIEHKSVLEPLARLREHGFEIELVKPTSAGLVDAAAVASVIRDDTLLVSMMHVNNETGVVQPVSELARRLDGSEVLIHVDAAQGFAKEVEALSDPRIDLISISAHKLFAPKGVGALVVRRRDSGPVPIEPLVVGGGQERGLRSGTLPVGLIASFGLASDLAVQEFGARRATCSRHFEQALDFVSALGGEVNGSKDSLLGNAINFSIPGIDSETFVLATKSQVALSNGSACTSSSYEPSHVLLAMGLPDSRIDSAVRISWSYLTPEIDWRRLAGALQPFVATGVNVR